MNNTHVANFGAFIQPWWFGGRALASQEHDSTLVVKIPLGAMKISNCRGLCYDPTQVGAREMDFVYMEKAAHRGPTCEKDCTAIMNLSSTNFNPYFQKLFRVVKRN